MGRLCMERDGVFVTHFRTLKAGALLAYLAYHCRQSHPRDALIERFWPDISLEAAHNNFRVVLSMLRRCLEPPDLKPGSVLIADRSHVQIHPPACRTDVVAFEAALESERHSGSDTDRVTLLTRAVELYSGELLPGYDDLWILPERQRLSDVYLGALRRLIKYLVKERDFDRAAGFARRAIDVDPLREESHRNLMRLYSILGRPAAALQQYTELQRILQQALGAEPSPTMRDFAMQLANGIGEELRSPVPSHNSQLTPAGHKSDRYPDVATETAPSPHPIRNNLPQTWNLFFGREEELCKLHLQLLSPVVRLVTLTGPPGSGKTRLAIEGVKQMSSAPFSTLCFVPLAHLTNPQHIAPEILKALSIPRSPQTEPLEQILQYQLQQANGQKLLLVLDNFEHLLEAGAGFVRTLLEQSENVICLVTSRQRLEIEGEQELLVLPLPVPLSPCNLECLMTFASVRLFIARAQEVCPDFRITPSNRSALAALCNHLDGLPLAIELASALADTLTPTQMLERLTTRTRLPILPRKDPLPHHQTLRAALAWSYHLLTREEQHCLTRLSVFRSGWTIEAAEAVAGPQAQDCPPSSNSEMIALLRRLRTRSLILAEENGVEMRFRMLETVRDYAAEQLEEQVLTRLARRHADYFLRFAEHVARHLTGPDQSIWMARLNAEQDNLRAALNWSLTSIDPDEIGLKLAGALWRFWEIRGHVREGRDWLESFLKTAEGCTPARARALHGAACLAGIQRDYVVASSHFQASMAIYQQLGNKQGINSVLIGQAIVAKHRGETALARQLLETSLTLSRELGESDKTANTLLNLGSLAFHQGDYAAARPYYEESLARHRQSGNDRFVALALIPLGNIAYHQRYFDAACSLYEEGLRILRPLDDKRTMAISLLNLGNVAFHQGRHTLACSVCEESLELFLALGDEAGIASFLEVAATGAWLQGNADRSIRLSAAAHALRRAIGAPLAPNEQADREIHLRAARAALSEAHCAEAEAHGDAMTRDQAIAYASETLHNTIERV